MTQAAYDTIAEWYENTFLAGQRVQHDGKVADPLGIEHALDALLGDGTGPCLDIGCGTGIFAEQIGRLGWEPIGIDLSGPMLRFAASRFPSAPAAPAPYIRRKRAHP
ncbi:methyltransferase domain-containing protein [Nocardia sp. NPDC060256]|uniref:methyltransferase domain-containing protein n=1 Tax=unclassified Nocardia TaxID=2637762 RepID=UPI00364B62C1